MNSIDPSANSRRSDIQVVAVVFCPLPDIGKGPYHSM
jgi:hypothetical protein